MNFSNCVAEYIYIFFQILKHLVSQIPGARKQLLSDEINSMWCLNNSEFHPNVVCTPPGCSQAITRSGSYWLLILHTVNTSKHQFHHCKDAICLNEASSQPVKPSWHSREAQNAANPRPDSHINISHWLHRMPITLVSTAQPAYFINGAAERSGQSYHWSIMLLCYIIKTSSGHRSSQKTHKSSRGVLRGLTPH